MKQLLLLSIILFIVGCDFYSSSENLDFNTTSWENDIDNRYKMKDDLITNYLSIGMSRESVEGLIGITSFSYYPLGSNSYNYTYELYIIYDVSVVTDFYIFKSYL